MARRDVRERYGHLRPRHLRDGHLRTEMEEVATKAQIRPLPIDQSLIFEDWVSDFGVARTGNTVTSWTGFVNSLVLTAIGTPSFLINQINGHPSIRGDGIADALTIAGFDLSSVADFEVFMVMRRVSATTSRTYFGYSAVTPLARCINNASNRITASLTGNVGVDGEQETNSTIPSVWRTYELTYRLPIIAGFEAQGFYDSTRTQFNSRFSNNNNTDPNWGTQELRLLGLPGGGSFMNAEYARFSVTQVLSAAERLAVLQQNSEDYGVP